jgi:chemotaxis protein methyltransferase CheR
VVSAAAASARWYREDPTVSVPGSRVAVDRSLSEEDYHNFRRFLAETSGIVLGESKHYLVTSRLVGLVEQFGFGSISELVRGLAKGGPRGLRERVVEAMTTNETFWFRDGFPFEIFKDRLLPEYAKTAKAGLRVWCAACSSGQEPYSLSMAVQEYTAKNPGALRVPVEIIGTDISPGILAQAREARYDSLSMARGLSAERKARFFQEVDERWQVRPEIRARVSLRELNLLQNYSLLGRFDIVFCRNVLIYFSPESKRDILERISKVLNPGGYLFLGASESMSGYSDAFEMVRCNPGVVYRKR